MIVLDTTVLVYATGADHPMREPCREVVAAVADGRIKGTTTVDVLQQFVEVRARHLGRDDAAHLGRAYADLLAPLLPVTVEHLREGLRLLELTERLGAFDAVLAAAARAAEATALVSADPAFGGVRRLRHLTPDSPALARLITPR